MVRASHRITEYQRLLSEDESLGSVKRAIELVRGGLDDLIDPKSGRSLVVRFDGGSTVSGKPLVELIDPSFVDQLRAAGRARKDARSTHPRLRTLATETSAGLALVAAVASSEAGLTKARCSLLLDSCVVLAHHAYFALLPRLDDAALDQEKRLFLTALHHFANSLNAAADRFSLLALYFDAMGQSASAMEARRAALAATPSEAHEFMTILQDAWSFLIERGIARDALELLLDTYPRVPRRDLEELNHLIRETFNHVVPRNGQR